MRLLVAPLCFALVLACSQGGAISAAPPTPATSLSPTPAVAQSVAPSPAVSPPLAPSASPSPALSGGPLFAVLEARAHPESGAWDTVAIAGLDGYARARATFTPLPRPVVFNGCMGVVPPTPARTTAGAVYFADSGGAVRRLTSTGAVTLAATFPLVSTQQLMSFAVSPDGNHLMAAILTLPPSRRDCQGDSNPPGAWANDIYVADIGGLPRLILHDVWTPAPAVDHPVLELTGWDAMGPRGTAPSVVGTQGGGPHSSDGLAVRVDASSGKVTGPVAPPSCSWPAVAPSGEFACLSADGRQVLVMRPDRTESWRTTPQEIANFEVGIGMTRDSLAPDGKRIVYADAVYSKDGGRVNLKTWMQGWIDNQTLIGNSAQGANLASISLAWPDVVNDLGFKGLFVGGV